MHAQALLVLDDEDFHARQDMLSLGQHRAIATALNSLVFHTHCPAPPALPQRRLGAATAAGPASHARYGCLTHQQCMSAPDCHNMIDLCADLSPALACIQLLLWLSSACVGLTTSIFCYNRA